MAYQDDRTFDPSRAQQCMQIVGDILGGRGLVRRIAVTKSGAIIETCARERRDRLFYFAPIRNVAACTLDKNCCGRACTSAHDIELMPATDIDQMFERIFGLRPSR